MKNTKPWSKDEINLVKELYDKGLNDKEISNHLVNRTALAVQQTRYKNGFTYLSPKKWTEEEIKKLIELYEKYYSDEDIGRILNRPTKSVTYIRLKRNITYITKQRYSKQPENAILNENMFYNGKELKQIPNAKGYYLDKKGNMYSFWKNDGSRGRYIVDEVQLITKGSMQKTGYYRLQLKDNNGKPFRMNTHQAMALTWIGERPEGQLVCHKNDIKTDNYLENLYYGTPKDNMEDRRKNSHLNEGENHGQSVLTDFQREYILSVKSKIPVKVLAEHFNVHENTILYTFKKNNAPKFPTCRFSFEEMKTIYKLTNLNSDLELSIQLKTSRAMIRKIKKYMEEVNKYYGTIDI